MQRAQDLNVGGDGGSSSTFCSSCVRVTLASIVDGAPIRRLFVAMRPRTAEPCEQGVMAVGRLAVVCSFAAQHWSSTQSKAPLVCNIASAVAQTPKAESVPMLACLVVLCLPDQEIATFDS